MYLPLDRRKSKILAIALIAMGIILLPDILVPTPGMDLINLAIAMPIADLLGIAYLEAVMLTFMIAFGLLIAGFLIYPYNTMSLISGRLHAAVAFMMANPLILVVTVGIFVIMFMFGSYFYDNYYQILKEYATQLVGSLG